ncbi:mitochondrial carrier domain-containing protein [Melampsora americana]|nr:mitochondrial carrier domain-containing protein [Melampsora americana]
MNQDHQSDAPSKIINLAHLPPLAQAFTGAIGATVSNALVYPLDLITTRMQTRAIRSTTRVHGSEANLMRPNLSRQTSMAQSEKSYLTTTTTRTGARRRNYSTVRESFFTILRIEPDGLRAFYHGLLIDTCATMLSSFIYFYVYTLLHKIVAIAKQHHQKHSSSRFNLGSMQGVLGELFMGALAGMMSKAFTCPLSNITVRLQTSKPTPRPPPKVMDTPMSEYPPSMIGSGSDSDSDSDDETNDRSRKVLGIIASIRRERGWLGFWSGYLNNCILTLNPSLTFYLMKLFVRNRSTFLETFLGSAIASNCATILTYPLMLSKTLIQTKGGKQSAYQILKQRLIKSDGDWKAAFFMGLGGQLAKGFIGQGVTMSVKSQLEKLMIKLYAKIKVEEVIRMKG